LLTSASVSAIVLLAVASLFNVSAGMMAQGQRQSDVFSEGRAAMEFIRRDLEGCVTSKHREGGITATGIAFGSTDSEEFGAFENRYFVPFEHNRYVGQVFEDLPTNSWNLNGTALPRALMNAHASGVSYHENYDTLAFTTRANQGRQVHTSIERGENEGEERNIDKRYRNTGEVCLSAFYVAYTYDSALENSDGSMKLFRHFRDSGSAFTGIKSEAVDIGERHLQSRARSVITKIAEPMLIQIEAGNLDNADLPYLLMPVNQYYGAVGKNTRRWFDAMHIWPRNYVSLHEDLPSDMPNVRTHYTIAWKEFLLDDNYVWGDEPLAFNVVEFKCRPLRRGPSGHFLDAESLNMGYGLNASNLDEWPVVLAPDVIEVELRVISDEVARKFQNQGDWETWKTDPVLNDLVERESMVFREHIYVGSADIGHER